MRRAELDKLDEGDLPQKKKRTGTTTGSIAKFTWLWNPFSIGFVGAIVGSLFTYMVSSNTTNTSLASQSRTQRENLVFQLKLVAIGGICDVGGSTGRDLRQADPQHADFTSVSLKGITNKKDLRRAIAYAALLPGLERLDLEDSAADNSVLEDIEANFSRLKYLNIGGTKVTSLNSIENLKLSELNINQTPILDFSAIGQMNNLTKLTFDPPTLHSDGVTPYKLNFAETLRGPLVEAKNLWDFRTKINLDDATKKLLNERKPVE